MNLVILVLFTVSFSKCSKSAKILGIFPFPAPSHYILGNSLMRGLAEKGHEVTIITPFEENNPPKNGKYKNIVLTGFREASEARRKKMSLFDQVNVNPFIIMAFMNKVFLESTENTLNHTNVQKLLHSNEKFDVVIVEQFMNDALKAFALHFKAPLILFSTIGANAWVNLLAGNPSPPSYVPALFMSVSNKMTFYERNINTLMYLFTETLNYFYIFPIQAYLVRKYFPPGIELNDILYNASLILLNSHESTNQAVPHVPNMIDIGGFHVHPAKKLPQDLQKFMDEAKDGVIYFSLGSNLKSSDLPTEKRDAILKNFATLKHKVLWKWENDILPGQPENVKLSKWFPQQDILAHHNLKVFITHGGLLSTTEAVYHGVAVLAIPIFGDQKINAQNIVNGGYGLALGYQELTEELFGERLNEILNNTEFSKNAKKRSDVFHDRLNSPMETALYWVEYVVKHRGAPHLRVAGIDLPLYQYFLLDVIFINSVLMLIVFYVSAKIVKKICSFCCKKASQEKVKKS